MSTSDGIDQQLHRYRPPGRHWSAWQMHEPDLRQFDYPTLRTMLLDRDIDTECEDAVFHPLRRVSASDPEAVSCLPACLYPGLCRVVSRFRLPVGRDEAWSIAVVAITARSARVDTSRHNIGLDLLHAAASNLHRSVLIERAWRERVVLDHGPEQAPPDPLLDDVVDDVLTSDCTMDALDSVLIRATRLDGVSLGDAAALLGLVRGGEEATPTGGSPVGACPTTTRRLTDPSRETR